MVIYFIILIIALLLATQAEKNKNLQKQKSLKYKNILIIVLSFFIGFRYNVGADYSAYIFDYFKITGRSYQQILFSSEFSFKLMVKICQLLYDTPSIMFLVASVIFVILSINTIYKYSDHFAFSVVLFILCGAYLDSCNAIRQSIAMAIIFSSYGFIRERRLVPFMLLVVLASTFHASAIVLLPIYFFLSRQVNLANIIILITIAVIMSSSYDFLYQMTEKVLGKEVSLKAAYMTTQVNIFRVLVALAPCGLFLFVPKSAIAELSLPINLILFNGVLMCMTANSAYLARIAMYSNIFVCLALPKVFYSIKIPKASLHNLKYIMLLCYAVFWAYGILNSAMLYPYRSIFFS